MLWSQVTLCGQACCLWYLPFQQKIELSHYTSTAQFLKCGKAIHWKKSTVKNKPRKSCLLCSYSQLDKQPRPSQQLMMTGVAGVEEMKDSTLDRRASPASKALNLSRPHPPCHPCFLHHLMSLVLPISSVSLRMTNCPQMAVVRVMWPDF